MKQERQILEKKLQEILHEMNKTGLIKEILKSSLLDEYMNRRMLTKTLGTDMPLNNLSVFELFHICRLINEMQKRIVLEDYFTDDEMTNAMENKTNVKVQYSPTIELKNCSYSKNNGIETWICIVTYKDLYNMMKSGSLYYNMATQRAGVMRRFGKEMLVVPYLNETSIKEIKDTMSKNEFYANMISFNVTPDYNEKLEYSPSDRVLRINTDTFQVSIIDGMHRISAAMRAIEENPNLQGELFLKVTSMSVEKAQSFIRQESKSNAQDKDALEKYNPTNKITMFINNINTMFTEEANVLKGKIDMEVNTPDTWIPFDLFKEGLILSGFMNKINETDSKKELENIEKYIVNFFKKFYDGAKEKKIEIGEENTVGEYLNDPVFIMGLLSTAFKYFKNNDLDSEKISVFMKKFKRTKTKYTYDYPLSNKDKKELLSKFYNLLEVE